MKIARRILWSLYAVPITLLFLLAEAAVPFLYTNPLIIPFTVLDFCISFPGLIALQLHIWDIQLFHPAVWKIYAFVMLAWDFCFNILVEPRITGERFGLAALIGLCVLIPLYVAVFRYAFRRWTEVEGAGVKL